MYISSFICIFLLLHTFSFFYFVYTYNTYSYITNIHNVYASTKMNVWCSPPEELVLPKEFPRVRIPFLAALLSPIAWQVGRPDLFDSYSAGVLLLQMAGQLAGLGYDCAW